MESQISCCFYFLAFAAWTPNERTAVLPSWPPVAFLSVLCLSLSFLPGPRLQLETPEQIPVFSSFCHWSILGLVRKLFIPVHSIFLPCDMESSIKQCVSHRLMVKR